MAYCKKWQEVAASRRKAMQMTHDTIDYEGIIHAAGHRVTPQRVLILDAVCDGGGHTTLGEIYARVREVDRSIDRSTLYRTLKLFVELGLVVSADTGDGEVYYEIAKPHRHHHLVCRQCGKEQEIEHTLLQPMFDQVAQTYGFQVDTDHLVLFGTCTDCQNANQHQHP
jgi:Fur family ferric uptake transcriptional regulator